jgi:hypothetical protein
MSVGDLETREAEPVKESSIAFLNSAVVFGLFGVRRMHSHLTENKDVGVARGEIRLTTESGITYERRPLDFQRVNISDTRPASQSMYAITLGEGDNQLSVGRGRVEDGGNILESGTYLQVGGEVFEARTIEPSGTDWQYGLRTIWQRPTSVGPESFVTSHELAAKYPEQIANAVKTISNVTGFSESNIPFLDDHGIVDICQKVAAEVAVNGKVVKR